MARKKWDKWDRVGQQGSVPLFRPQAVPAEPVGESGTEKQRRVIRGAHEEAPAPPASSLIDGFAVLYAEAVADYLRELRRRGKAEGTMDKARRDALSLGLFLQALPHPPRTLGDITVELVCLYRDHEMTRERKWRGAGKLASATVRRQVAMLRGFFRHLVKRGVLLLDPAVDLAGPKRLRTLPRQVPTARQMSSLLGSLEGKTALDRRDRAVVELMYSSGLRNAELCALSVRDVDLGARTVFVRKGKGGHERLVPIGKKAAAAIALYLEKDYAALASRSDEEREDAPLFLNRVGRPLEPESVRRLLALRLSQTKLRVKATPHSLRHACATHLLKGGAGIRQIQLLLGHQRLDSTQVYTHVVTKDLMRMLDRHHPRGEGKVAS